MAEGREKGARDRQGEKEGRSWRGAKEADWIFVHRLVSPERLELLEPKEQEVHKPEWTRGDGGTMRVRECRSAQQQAARGGGCDTQAAAVMM